jgi:hypothetical protein
MPVRLSVPLELPPEILHGEAASGSPVEPTTPLTGVPGPPVGITHPLAIIVFEITETCCTCIRNGPSDTEDFNRG